MTKFKRNECESMSEDKFEKLKKIAKEEFGVELIRSNKPSDFKIVFGFDVKDIKDLKEK